MNNQKLLEAVADIAYYAGQKKFYTGDSRADISEFIRWANQFEKIHKNTIWDSTDYITAIEEFAENKINAAHA